MKVSPDEKQQMQDDYQELRNKGYTKSVARQIISEKYDRGLTTVWDNTHQVDEEQIEVNFGKDVDTGAKKTYILTGWEIRVKPDYKFIACLEQMAQAYDAELILVPLSKSDSNYLPEKLKEKFNVVMKNLDFNENLQLKFVESSALIQSPLGGHSGAYPNKTTILPGLIRELKTEPSQFYVKQLMSTGSVGYLSTDINNYPDTDDKELARKLRNVTTRMHGRPTAIAQNYVLPSALVVDVLDDKTFLTRFVASERSGVVYDLDKKFTPDGYEHSEPLGLVVGDTHAYTADSTAIEATFEMIDFLNPREVILNDFLDGRSINHHEAHDAVKSFEAPSLEEERDVTLALLSEFHSRANRLTYIQSNHCNFLLSWLNSPQAHWRFNRNYKLACELQLYRMKTGKHPIIHLLNLDSFNKLKFVAEKDKHFVGKVLIKHGHEGLNGARTGFLAAAKTYNYYVQGHTHSPSVYRNAVQVGLTAELFQGYNNECGSNWGFANAIIHKDSTMQLLNIIDGKWRL